MPNYKQDMIKVLADNSFTDEEKRLQAVYDNLSENGEIEIEELIKDKTEEVKEFKTFVKGIESNINLIDHERYNEEQDAKEEYANTVGENRNYRISLNKKRDDGKEWDDNFKGKKYEYNGQSITVQEGLHEFCGKIMKEYEEMSAERVKAGEKILISFSDTPTFKSIPMGSDMYTMVANYYEHYKRLETGDGPKKVEELRNAPKIRDDKIRKANAVYEEKYAAIENIDQYEDAKKELKEREKELKDLKEYSKNKDAVRTVDKDTLTPEGKKAGLDLLTAARAEYRNKYNLWQRIWANILKPSWYGPAKDVEKINAYKEALKENGVQDKDIDKATPENSDDFTYDEISKKFVSNTSMMLDRNAVLEESNVTIIDDNSEKKVGDKKRVSETNKNFDKEFSEKTVDTSNKKSKSDPTVVNNKTFNK